MTQEVIVRLVDELSNFNASDNATISRALKFKFSIDNTADDVHVSGDKANVVNKIVSLSTVDTLTLVKELQEKWGISAAPAAVAAASQEAAAPVEEKTSFNVILKKVEADVAKKLAAIKAVRSCNPSLQLAEAKSLVEKAIDGQPQILATGVSKQDAEKMQSTIVSGVPGAEVIIE